MRRQAWLDYLSKSPAPLILIYQGKLTGDGEDTERIANDYVPSNDTLDSVVESVGSVAPTIPDDTDIPEPVQCKPLKRRATT